MYLRQLDFTPSASDASLFIYKDRDNFTYLPLYIDYIILTASHQTSCVESVRVSSRS
jgi:hypothetical protein